jgi:drug/metabolite transporter (DMT)-like permease
MKNQQKSYVFALTAILFWSTVATAFKIGLRYFDFIQLLFFTTLIASVILLVILYFEGKLKTIFTFSLKQYLQSAALGFLNPFLYYMVLLKAYSVLPAQVAQPLNYTWPIMLVILSVPLLHQKLAAKSILAILLSFVGVLFISSRGSLQHFDFSQPLGIALASGSSIVWALYWIYNVRDKRDETQKLFLNFIFGLLFIGLAILFYSDFNIKSVNGLYAALYLGFFEMGLSFVLWMKAMQLTSSSAKIGNLVFISPFLALIFIHFILGEKIYLTTILGLALIVVGIVLQQVKFGKKEG